MQQQQYTQLNKVRRRSAILVALILHLILGIVYVFTPHREAVKDNDHIAVEWVDPPKRGLKILKTKPPLKMRVHRPDEDRAHEAKHKLAESPRHNMTEVVRLSERIIHENLEVKAAPLTEKMPEMMTEANLRESERSNIGRPVSLRADGRGKVTERMRLRGQRTGLSLVDSLGDSKDGRIDGGGNPAKNQTIDDKVAKITYKFDKLGMIKFIGEFKGQRQVVYCLDVSASMQVVGLKKLELAIKSIKESLLALNDDDHFNIITFSAHAKRGKRKLAPATMKNIKAASKYLDRFTPERIAQNQGTNILEALEKALEMNPSIIVLVTDGLPTAGANKTDLLFRVDMKVQHNLDRNNISVVRQIFENNGISLSQNVSISIPTPGSQWRITDGNQIYYVQKKGGKLNIYTAIQTGPEGILEAVRTKNVNRAGIYVVGLEIDLHASTEAHWLVSLTEQNNGWLKIIDRKQLEAYAKEDLTTPDF